MFLKELTLQFRKLNNHLAKPIMATLGKGFKSVIKSRNKKIKDAQAELIKIPEEAGHYGGFDVIITGPDDFVDSEEKKISEALTKLLKQYSTDPKLAGKFYHKFKQMAMDWADKQILAAYSMIGISLTWDKKEV